MTAPKYDCCQYDYTHRIAHYDFDGSLTSVKYMDGFWEYTSSPYIVADNQGVFLGLDEAVQLGTGDWGFDYSDVIVKLSDSVDQPLPAAQVHSLGDINDDGHQDMVVFTASGVGTPVAAQKFSVGNKAAFKDTIYTDSYPPSLAAESSDLAKVHYYSHLESMVDSKVMPPAPDGTQVRAAVLGYGQIEYDWSNYQAVMGHHVVLSDIDYSNYATTQDKKIRFLLDDPEASPEKLLILPDLNGNQHLELAVLSTLPNKQGVFVEVKDSDTGEALYRASFNPNFSPKDLALVEDLNGDALPELALLSFNEVRGFSKIEVRSLTGGLIKNIWPGNKFVARSFVLPGQSEPLQPVAVANLGVIQAKPDGTGIRVALIDVAKGKPVKYKWLNPNFKPVKAFSLADINSNSHQDIAVLTQNRAGSGSNLQLKSRIEVYDSNSNQTLKRTWQRKNATVYDMALLPDVTGNQSQETATLVWQDGMLRLRVQDSLTGKQIDLHSVRTYY